MDDGELPMPKDKYVTLIHLCVELGPFRGREDEQIEGITISLPLSAVLAQVQYVGTGLVYELFVNTNIKLRNIDYKTKI